MRKRLKALLMWGDPSPRARRHRLFCLACALIILACAAYVASYYIDQRRVRREGEAYRAMYSPAPLAMEAPVAAATTAATATVAPTPSPAPTASPTASPAPTATPAAFLAPQYSKHGPPQAPT